MISLTSLSELVTGRGFVELIHFLEPSQIWELTIPPRWVEFMRRAMQGAPILSSLRVWGRSPRASTRDISLVNQVNPSQLQVNHKSTPGQPQVNDKSIQSGVDCPFNWVDLSSTGG